MIEVNSKVPENLYPAFFRCAMLICTRFSFLPRTSYTVQVLRTMSSVDWIYFVQNSKIHPSLHQTVSQLPTLPSYRIHLWSENTAYFVHSTSKGSFLEFFFNSDVTVFLLIPNTLPISRTPLLLSVISIIFSFVSL